MINSATIFWKNEEVGKVSNIVNDMWYFDADWQPTLSTHTTAFENIVSKVNPDEVMRFPTVSTVISLQYDKSVYDSQKMLVLSLKDSKIFMRLITEESAAYLEKRFLAPWQPVNDPAFYEIQLKKEISFFHPLKWKKLKAIGLRIDSDDVLFEIENGVNKYAIVHLTYTKERLKKFPLTKFYKDWSDLHGNRLLHDYKAYASQL